MAWQYKELVATGNQKVRSKGTFQMTPYKSGDVVLIDSDTYAIPARRTPEGKQVREQLEAIAPGSQVEFEHQRRTGRVGFSRQKRNFLLAISSR